MVVVADGVSYPIDLHNYGSSEVKIGTQLDDLKPPSIPQWKVGMDMEIHCTIRGTHPGTAKTKIEWKEL